MTWRALSALGQSSGAPVIDYDRFSAQWDQEGEDGILHQLVDRFDSNGLVIKTDQKEPAVTQHKEKESNISKTAKRAALKGLKK